MFVVTDTGRATLVSSDTGRIIWSKNLGSPVYASPSALGNTLLVPTTRGRLLAISSVDGSRLWEFYADNGLIRLTSPATDGHSVYVGSSDGTAYRLEASTGKVLWRFEGPDAIVAPPLLTDAHLIIGTMGRMLYVFDRTSGELVWETKLKGRIKSGLSVRNGYLIILAEPRYIYGFKTEALDAAIL